MMRKYLMTGLAAVALSGLFSGCSQDAETGAQINTAEFNILENYENAFVTRFGQPAANQDWGFGSSAGTRGVVATPYVRPLGKTYNAQMAQAWVGVEAAKATGSDANLFSGMNDYLAWKNSGWDDQFYEVHGTVVDSNLDPSFMTAVTNVIVGTEGKPGLIPEGTNNLATAVETGYSIVTTGGPVTLTPIYHNSNSGDRLSYYYYPVGQKPSPEQIKKMPKYSLGEMSSPNPNNHTQFHKRTYSLVFVKPDGSCTYNFDAGYVINFVISNTWNDYNGATNSIYQEGGITTTTAGSAPTLTSQGKYQVSGESSIQSGTEVDAINNKVKIRFGNTLTPPKFSATQQGSINNTNFTLYTRGNGVKGTLNGNSTCYYFKANNQGYLRVGVHQNGGQLKVYESKNALNLSSENNWTSADFTELTNDNTNNEMETPSSNDGILGFPVKNGYVYAVYSDGGELGYYGYHYHWSKYNAEPAEDKPMIYLGEIDCGTIYNDRGMGFVYIHAMLGKKPACFDKPKSNTSIDGYSALTEGTGINGGLSQGATTYYFKPSETGVLRVAVVLNKDKAFYVKDLGSDWNATSGTSLDNYNGKTVSSKYTGTYDFPVEANHVYAVYAEGSKLGFYGCEFFTQTAGSESTTSTSTVVWKNIPMTPDYYSDGDLNTEIHNTGYGYGVGSAASTSHTAVFKSTVNNIDYTFIGFEDWIDFDYNDLVFAITGTTPETPQDPIEIPEDPVTPEDPTDPGTFVCRIIAEDLTVGENSDFDFNDVVFDVFNNNGTTTIRLRAAGGELPLYVDGHEVHQEFATKYSGITTTTLVNTGWRGSTLDYNNYYVDFTIGRNCTTPASANEIPVVVTKKGKNNELVDILLTAREGKVASKVCVGRDYEWCAEREDIDSKYHNGGVKLFHEYVVGNLSGDWANQNAWYQQK